MSVIAGGREGHDPPLTRGLNLAEQVQEWMSEELRAVMSRRSKRMQTPTCLPFTWS